MGVRGWKQDPYSLGSGEAGGLSWVSLADLLSGDSGDGGLVPAPVSDLLVVYSLSLMTSFLAGKASWRLVLPQRQGLESARLHPGCGFLDLSSQALATPIQSWP